MSKKRSWRELSTRSKLLVILGGIIETALTAAAVKDMKARPNSMIRGPKWLWLMASFVQPFGPIAYFLFGRRTSN